MTRLRLLLWLVLAPTVAIAGVRVRVAPLSDESCRSDLALTEQLRTTNGITIVERDFEFEAVLERHGADWQITLQKPNGTIALRRSLTGAKDCADVSFAAGLIIERFAHALDVAVPPSGVALKPSEPKPPEVKIARPKAAETKAAETKAAETKAAETKAAETKAAETKAAETKAAETKAAETKAAETKAAETKAAETKAAETKAAETKATETKAAETKAAETKAAETKAAETKAAETKAAETKAAETKAAETKAAETKAAETKAAETKAAETKAAETKAETKAETRAAETKAAETKAAETKAASLDSARDERAAEPRKRVTRYELAASGAAWFATGFAPRPGFDLEASFFLFDRWRLALQLAITTNETNAIVDSDQLPRGVATTQPFLALIGANYCRGFAAQLLRGCGGVVVGADFAVGTASGPFIYRSTPSLIARPSFGLEAQLGWLPFRHFTASLALTGLVGPQSVSLTIDATPTYSPPLFEGLLRLSLAFGSDT